MQKIIYRGILFFIIINMISLPYFSSHAAQFDTLYLEEAEEIPEYLDIQISDIYVEKEHFSQAQVRDDGWFGLLSVITNTGSDNVFAYTYIDLYDEDGNFQKAIRMNYSKDIVFEMTKEGTIDIYINDYALRIGFHNSI